MVDLISPAQLARFEVQLRQRRIQLREIARQHAVESEDKRSRVLAEGVPEVEDGSDSELPTEVDAAEAGRELEELREVDDALTRIENGAYGTCVACGGAVPYQRLLVQPTAKRCLRCQVKHEQGRVGVRGRAS